jgi:hypothetical protein
MPTKTKKYVRKTRDCAGCGKRISRTVFRFYDRYNCDDCWRAKMRAGYHRRKKQNASNRAVAYAIKTGRLVRQPCRVCAKYPHVNPGRVLAHHWDYDKPLDVEWLCIEHHAAWHRVLEAINREPTTKPKVRRKRQ